MAAYGEINEESRDIMTIQIGNVAPQTDVKIEISCVEELTLRLNTFYNFDLTTRVLPRYLNRLPKNGFL